VLDGHVLPGSDPHRIIGVFGSCHDRPWGALAIVDRRLGVDGREPVLRTWPPDAVGLVMNGDLDTFKNVRPRYEDPYPLSDKHFLCSRQVGNGEETALYPGVSPCFLTWAV
jgi:hypothetical protein